MGAMSARTVVITGPTRGIGTEIARGLARQGADLVLACRDVAAGRKLAGELAAAGAAAVDVLRVDMASHASIKELAARVLAAHPRVHVLVNNAGVSLGTQPWTRSAEGIEITFGTNVLGYYRLSLALLPRLKECAPSRIVNVASTFASDLDLDDLEFKKRPWDSMKAYAQSKACDRLLTWALSRRLSGTGVTANAMAPGLVVETGLYRHAPPDVMGRLRQRGGGRTPADGADTAVWLASAAELEGLTGKLFENRAEIPCAFRGRENEERLWEICERLSR